MSNEKTIEQKYQKLSQREHVLKRSGMYIGDIKKNIEELWVMNENNKMVKKFVDYSPGFIKIFDEVLSNATDHAINDPTVTKIEVTYNKETGEISVYNNGTGVPVVLHKEHNIYVPELIFGNMLSGSNYDDTESKIIVGTNGVGVKAVSIFSKKFIVETVCSVNKKKYIQEFSNNMADKTKPKITKVANTKSYTKITFLPDYQRFDMKNLEDDAILLIKKRVYDCIVNTKANMYLNGEKIKGKSFTDYIKFYFDDSKIISEQNIQTIKGKEYIWEYAIVPYEQYEQISFVNGNYTKLGGKHVDYILYQIINKIKELLETKKKLKNVKPNFIKDKFFFFLKSTLINYKYDSQIKDKLITQISDFGCKIEVTDTFINKIYKSSIIDEIVEFCKLKESSNLSRITDGKKQNKLYNIPKLEDATYAGTAKSDQCTLILTEGDSAKTFAMWGRSVTGPDKLGIFPLKGKLLNIRDASLSQLINNEEINNIKQILGLKENKEYLSTKELRYANIMILTDSDVDGSHIKALILNFIHNGWPSLLKINPNSFIKTLKTPIVKAFKGKEVKEFFTEQDYHIWLKGNNTKNYKIKYYKGLGTSKKEDAKDIFKRFNELVVNYYYKDKKCDEAILLAFDKDKNKVKKIKDTDTQDSDEQLLKCTDLRKVWLANYNKDLYININENKVSFQDLINKELIHFSIYDNSRSIPSICDGLKPSQRKILYYMLKNNIKESIKVSRLSGKISSETSYHHGEASLEGAIINLAQDFVGSNNINLLFPDGNFGSRLLGGKDAASARYIETNLSDITSLIFNKLDTPLLQLLEDDGIEIEPEWYLPIIPMILVNGCEGIGTGYSTSIPPYNPKNLVDNILRILKNKDPLPLIPFFKNFNGEMIKDTIKENTFITKGKWEKMSDTQIKITELPVGCWVTVYKEFLESLIESNKKDIKNKKRFVLKSVENKTKDENDQICFLIEFKNGQDLETLIKSNTLEKELKLTKSINTNNMHVFSESLILTKYKTPNDILLDWYDLRLEYYDKRRNYYLKKYSDELIYLNCKIRFVTEYINKQLDINKKSKDYIIKLLEENNYNKLDNTFDYLLNLPVYSFTLEKIESLEKQVLNKQNDLDYIKNKTFKELWQIDLLELQQKL